MFLISSFFLITAFAQNYSQIAQKDVWCCFHGYHYHECYEQINSEGCVIGSSIVWPRPKQADTSLLVGKSLKTLQYPTMNGGFMLCSDTPECAPTEDGGAFLRGVIKNCRECRRQLR